MKKISFAADLPQTNEFSRGVEAVVFIRCVEHYTEPQLNAAANGAECAVCEVKQVARSLRHVALGSVETERLRTALDNACRERVEANAEVERLKEGNFWFEYRRAEAAEGKVKALEARQWLCKANGTPEPQDCDWPQCGCDPRGRVVIEAIDSAICLALQKFGSHKPPCDPCVGTGKCTCGLDALLGLGERA